MVNVSDGLTRCVTLAIAAACGLAVSSQPAAALDNNAALQLTPEAGWTAMELISQGDNLSAVADAGYTFKTNFDGTGAYRSAGNTLTLLVNHETSQAAISRLELNYVSFKQAIASKIDGGVTP